MKNAILAAAKADAIPAGTSGLWSIQKLNQKMSTVIWRNKRPFVVPPGSYTILRRMTESTLHMDGEVVMEDTPIELVTHLQFMLRARGNVLVTGLGLGCVVRGLLANPNVTHITCIENSVDVLKLVAPHMPTDRLEIVQADALEWTVQDKRPFDCAWHDLWTNQEAGEPHLDVWHVKMMINCAGRVPVQGAWNLDRRAKAMVQRHFAPGSII